MSKICRTCTQSIITNEYFNLNGSSCGSSSLTLKHVLQSCIPEFDLNSMPNSVICRNCMLTLHIAHHFKTEAMKNQAAQETLQAVLCDVSVEELVTEIDEDVKVKVELGQNQEPANDYVEQIIECPPFHDYLKIIGNQGVDKIKVLECPPLVPFDDRLCVQETSTYKKSSRVQEMDIQVACSNIILQDCLNSDNKASSNDSNPENIQLPQISVSEPINLTANEPQNDYNETQSRRRLFECKDCDFRAITRTGLIRHRQVHTEDKPFHCDLCTYKAKRKAHLEDHIKIHTGERPFRCPICDKCFKTKRVMHEHRLLHADEKSYRCKQCDFRCKQKSAIDIHIRRVHMGIVPVVKHQPCICYVCGKSLARPSSLQTHMKIHTGVKSHLCTFCGKCFREKSVLKNHLFTHTGEKPYQCKDCDYITNRKAHVHLHAKAFGSHPNLVHCHKCKKRFPCQQFLNKHLKEDHNMEISAARSRKNMKALKSVQTKYASLQQSRMQVAKHVEEEEQQ